MKIIFLFLITILIISCGPGKINDLSPSSTYKFTTEYRYKLDADSKLRSNLLFHIADQIAEERVYAHKILDSYKDDIISKVDNYEHMNEGYARIFINYSDHTELIYLTSKINLQDVENLLTLPKKNGHQYYWLGEKGTFTEKGKSYYAVFATRDEIIDNDILNFKKPIDEEMIDGKILITSGLKLQVEVYFQYEIQTLSNTKVNGRYNGRFRKDCIEMIEACTCEVEILDVANTYEQYYIENDNQFNFVATLNGVELEINNVEILNVNHAQFEIIVPLSLNINKGYLEIHNLNDSLTQAVVSTKSHGFCEKMNKLVIRNINQTHEFKLTQFGRGLLKLR